MPHSNGKIYVDTTTTPHKGADFGNDIAYVLRSNSGDIGTLCTHRSINKWAKYKPIEVNSVGRISDDNREIAHHGFVASPGSENTMFEYSIPDLFTRYAANGGDYTYVKPTTRFRALDFVPPSLSGNGYNHNAPAPFVYNNPTQATSPTTNYVLNVTLNSNAGAELTIADIIKRNSYQHDMTKWYIALACKYVKGSSTYYKLARAKTTDGQDTPRTLAAFVKGERLYAEIQLDGFRTYEMLWVATEVDPSDPQEPGASVYLPLGGFSFTLNQTSITINYTFAWVGGGPQGASQYAYDKYGNYVPCCAVNFSSAFSRVTMAQSAPESRTATIYSTPILHLVGGGTIACEPIRLSDPDTISVNYTGEQIIDTTLIGTVLCKDGTENVAVSDVSYIELITQVVIDAGGTYIITLVNSNGDQRDNLYIY